MVTAAAKEAEKVAYEARVRSALDEAYAAADEAFKSFKASAQITPDGHIRDTCGGAYIRMYKPSYRFRTTLVSLGEMSRGFKGAWNVGSFTRTVNDQSITASEVACQAAANVLQKHFPEEPTFYMTSYVD